LLSSSAFCDVERTLNAENDRLLAQLADLHAAVGDHNAAD
jgi:hypothetical protein